MRSAGFLILEVFQEVRQRFKFRYTFHSGSRLPYFIRVVKWQNEDFSIYFLHLITLWIGDTVGCVQVHIGIYAISNINL